MIQFAWSVNPQDVFDELTECGVAWAEDSIDCVMSKVNMKMDIDLEKAISIRNARGVTRSCLEQTEQAHSSHPS